MPQYQKSNGEIIETETMPQPYLERALNKALSENNEANIQSLQEEMAIRDGSYSPDQNEED